MSYSKVYFDTSELSDKPGITNNFPKVVQELFLPT